MLRASVGKLIAHRSLVGLRRALRSVLVWAGEKAAGSDAFQGRAEGDVWYSIAMPGVVNSYVLTRGAMQVAGWAIDLASGQPVAVRVRLGRRVALGDALERADVQFALRRVANVPTKCGFGLDIEAPRGVHMLTVEAKAHPGRWVRLLRRIVISLPSEHGLFLQTDLWHYPQWAAREDAFVRSDGVEQRDYAAIWSGRPSVSIVLEPGVDPDGPEAAALGEQTYPAHEILGIGTEHGPVDLGDAFSRITGDYCVVLARGDRLRPDAIYTLAAAAQANPDRDILYADEDADGGGNDPVPFFKPAWSPDTLESFDYLGAPVAYRTSLLTGLAPQGLHDLALRVTENAVDVHHIPRVLCRRSSPPTASRATSEALAALGARRARRGGAYDIVHALSPSIPCFRPEPRPGDENVLVSIVVPMAGMAFAGESHSLRSAAARLRILRERSTYRNIEIVAVIVSGAEDDVRLPLADSGARVVECEAGSIDVAAQINLGARSARGEMLLLLDDVLEVGTPGWIEQMLLHASKPHVGAVGAKILSSDGSQDHVGVVTVGGSPGRLRRRYPGDDLGYVFSAAAPRNFGAVSGAAMMTRMEDFRAVDGFSEDFGGALSDVDYCFKLRARGLHVVFEPGATLRRERPEPIAPPEIARAVRERFERRWAQELVTDPFYPAHAFGTSPPNAEVFMQPLPHVS